MGIFDFGRRGLRSHATLDAGSGELKRNSMAKAIEDARNPAPARRHSMHVNAARMMFASADIGRLTGDWPTSPQPADWIITRFQRTLVARSREQASNNDIMKAYLRLQRINIVGPDGISFHSQVMDGDQPNRRARRAIEACFAKWGRRENCDIAGKLSWRALQSACCETAARDGEFFLRIITGADAGAMGFALQVIDPQRCPVELDRNDLPNGGFIRQGIEFNRYGKATHYFFADAASDRSGQGYAYNGKSYARVPAAEVIHGFVQEMPGQKRGLPWASTGLFRAKQVQAGEDASVVNMRIGAAKMGFIEFEPGTGPEVDDDEMIIDAEAGTFPVLPEGAKLKQFDPMYPAGELVPFVKLMHRAFATGGGVSYHSLTGDLTDVNFSSIRHGTLDERETYKERQEWLREELCDRVFDAFLPRALLARLVVDDRGVALPASSVDVYMARVWQPRRWSWIDPRADVQAAEDWKNNLLTSPSELIREKGRDPLNVWAETGADIAAMREAGIPMEVIAASFGQKPTAPPAAAETKGVAQE